MVEADELPTGVLALGLTPSLGGHGARPSSSGGDDLGYSVWRPRHNLNSTLEHLAGSATSNNGSDFVAQVSHTYSLPWMITVAVVLFLLIIVTIFGNALVVLSLLKYRYLRTVSNYLIGNLALSDFLLATTILPMSSVKECLGYWVFGEILCKFWLVADVLYCTASIWNLCIIAFDRFTATLYPLWYREKRTLKQGMIYIVIVWVFSFAICVPPLLGWNDLTQTYVYDNTTDAYQCVLFDLQGYVMYSASGSFYIPFFITLFLYIRIFGVLRHRIRRMRGSGKRSKQNKPAGKPKAVEAVTPTVPLTNSLSKPKDEQQQKQQQEFEMRHVAATEAHSSHSNKSLFGSDSQGDNHSDEEDSSTQVRSDHPLYVSSSEAEGLAQVAKNGIKGKGSPAGPDSGSAPLVIHNPNHSLVTESESDKDRDHIEIVVTEDAPAVRMPGGNKASPPKAGLKTKLLSVSKEVLHRNDSDRSISRRSMGNTLKHANPFKKDREKIRSSQKHKRYDQREVRATIRMAIIIAFFCGCWLGFFVIYVVRAFCRSCAIPRDMDAFFFWLGYSNSAMNPILYTIFNDDFRKAFQKLLGCYTRSGGGSITARTNH